MAALRQALDEFLRAIYPECCPVCGSPGDRPGPCARHLIPGRDVPRCLHCADRLPAGLPDLSRCAACARRSLGLKRVLTLGDYHPGSSLREWILALKHRGRVSLARPLGIALANTWREAHPGALEMPLLVPVPLHPVRRLERGYNQAHLLAASIACELGASLLQALGRRRWTEPQGVGPLARTPNVLGAFQPRRGMRSRLEGRQVWLVDDVLASGATLKACARTLRAQGARRVAALVVARSVRLESLVD